MGPCHLQQPQAGSHSNRLRRSAGYFRPRASSAVAASASSHRSQCQARTPQTAAQPQHLQGLALRHLQTRRPSRGVPMLQQGASPVQHMCGKRARSHASSSVSPSPPLLHVLRTTQQQDNNSRSSQQHQTSSHTCTNSMAQPYQPQQQPLQHRPHRHLSSSSCSSCTSR